MAHQAPTHAQEQTATPSAVSDAVPSNGKALHPAETSPLTGRSGSTKAPSKSPASQSASRSPAAAHNGSPDQRLPTTPLRASPHPHSPETPLSDLTTAGSSPTGALPAAVHQHQQHQTPLTSHPSWQDSPGVSDGLLGSTKWTQPQQVVTQQPAPGHVAPASSSAVQRDPVVQLVSRRNSGRVPPPGFSGPVAAPPAGAGAPSHGARHKV